jgi:AcrR family transcriptional regulator
VTTPRAPQASTAPKATRWAGVSSEDRVRERRSLLIAAAFYLFGTEGEAATSIRAVCRATSLNARYFYESFTDRDELLGAVYDEQAGALAVELITALEAAGADAAARTRAGIETVLRFITDDDRRAAILFTEGGSVPALAERRRGALEALVAATAEQGRIELGTVEPGDGGPLPRVAAVTATMFGGAMDELVRAWTDGRLGTELDPVLDDAVALSLAIFEQARRLSRP